MKKLIIINFGIIFSCSIFISFPNKLTYYLMWLTLSDSALLYLLILIRINQMILTLKKVVQQSNSLRRVKSC